MGITATCRLVGEVHGHRGGRCDVGCRVRSGAPVEDVGACSPDERVVARPADERVVARPAIKDVGAPIARQRIGVIRSGEILDLREGIGDEAGGFEPARLGGKLLDLRLGQRRVEDREVIDLAIEEIGGVGVAAEIVAGEGPARREDDRAVRIRGQITVDVEGKPSRLIGHGDVHPLIGDDVARGGGNARDALSEGRRPSEIATDFGVEVSVGLLL